jgi:hypothetical protein
MLKRVKSRLDPIFHKSNRTLRLKVPPSNAPEAWGKYGIDVENVKVVY